MLGAKKLLSAVACEVLDHVRKLASPVIAFARIPLSVFIREHRAHGFEHGFADEVLRSNQLQAFMLTADFVVNGGGNFRISFRELA